MPPHPISQLSYRSYWTYILYSYFFNAKPNASCSINEISAKTSIKTSDIISTLQHVKMVKEWKGQHVIHVEMDKVEKYLEVNKTKYSRMCKSDCLTWTPHHARDKGKKG